MVGLLQLILDDDHAVVREVAAKKVQRKTSDRMLSHVQFEVHAQQVGEHVNVLQEPRGEIVCLMHPHLFGRNRSKPPQVSWLHRQSGVGFRVHLLSRVNVSPRPGL